MAIVPIAVPDVPILWHNAVVDVEPTSRYGLDRDLASINSTICYVNPTGSPLEVSLLAPSGGETECNIRRQSRERPAHQEAEPLDLARYGSARRSLAEAGSGTAALDQILAASGKQFAGDVTLDPGKQVIRFHTRLPILPDSTGTYRLEIAAPLGAGGLAAPKPLGILILLPNEAPDFRVEVLSWSGAPVVHGGDALPLIAGRPVVAWSWTGEPFVVLRYRYRNG